MKNVIRVYYYNECCAQKNKVAGVVEGIDFNEFDNLSDSEQDEIAGFAVSDCSFLGGTKEEIIAGCDVWANVVVTQPDETYTRKKIAENIKHYLS